MTRSFSSVRRTCVLCVCGLLFFSGRLLAGNPLLTPSDAPYGAPRLDRIHAADIMPAIGEGIHAYNAEIARIRTLSPAEATFENVIVPLDRADSLLAVPRSVLGYLKSNFGTDSVIRISLESARLTGEAYDAVTLDTAIFKLVKAVYDRRADAGLDSLQLRTLGKIYRGYIRNGALCTPEQKERLKELNREISLKRIHHGQNITEATQNYVLYVQDSNLLDGLSRTTKQRFARNAARQGHPGMWAIGFQNGDYGSVVSSATNRDLRRMLYEAYTSRCLDGKYDNRQLSVDIINLRLERVRLLGYANYAGYTLETNMAKSPEKVYELLLPLKDAAVAKGCAEHAELEAFAAKYERDAGFRLEPWDVSYYSGKLRKERFGSELNRIRNYLLFDNVLKDGVFYAANRLYGITLTPRTDIPVFHPDVLTFEARDAGGRPLGLLYLDCFSRKGKRGGAWCSRLRGYSCAGGQEVLPLVTISCNFSRAAEGKPQLMSTAEVKTLFHEFGHALAGFFSRGPYPQVTGSFPRDMVELPSQLNEHWAWEPEVMNHYARDYQTGRPIPAALMAKFKESENFMKGLYLTDYYATTLLDLEWHTVSQPVEGCDVAAFEQAFLKRYGFPEHTAFRYRTTYYNHIFASSYPAQYYSYTWSAVLDTDAFAAFTETGDIFDPGTARRYLRYILTEAGYDEPMAQYVRFRGAVPDAKPLMIRYGLTE